MNHTLQWWKIRKIHIKGLFTLSESGTESKKYQTTRKQSSRMRTDRAITRPSSEPISMRPIVDRQTPVKTLHSLTVGNKENIKE